MLRSGGILKSNGTYVDVIVDLSNRFSIERIVKCEGSIEI
jgi:hypothetical protein